jgi:hypothetical protein
VLKIIEDTMLDATLEEQMQATFEFWQFFDALWAIAPGGHPKSPTCGHLKFLHPERGVTTS